MACLLVSVLLCGCKRTGMVVNIRANPGCTLHHSEGCGLCKVHKIMASSTVTMEYEEKRKSADKMLLIRVN